MSPAPEAAEPTFTVLPGNLLVTLVSTPDSDAGNLLDDGGEEAKPHTGIGGAVSVFSTV